MKSCTKLLLVLLFFVQLFFLNSCEDDKLPPQQTISQKYANTLEEEFKDTRASVINKHLGYEDTREFWFSIDSLKKYIEYVEYESHKKGHDKLGMRIYFAAYPANSDTPDPGYSTVFLVPTAQQKNSAIQNGFFPIAPIQENIKDLKALNYSQGGKPPKDF